VVAGCDPALIAMKPARCLPFLIVLALLAAFGSGQSARADGPNRAGLIIDYGGGQVVTDCISFDESSISGLEMLLRSGRTLVTGFGGGTVCSVDGVGCSDGNNCWCECQGSPCRYWIYYYLSGGQWAYSSQGYTARRVRDGDVEGWVWGEGQLNAGGAMPPLLAFDQLCAPLATSTPTDTPPPTDTPIVLGAAPTSTSPPPAPARTATPRPTSTPRPSATSASQQPAATATQAVQSTAAATQPAATSSPQPGLMQAAASQPTAATDQTAAAVSAETSVTTLQTQMPLPGQTPTAELPAGTPTLAVTPDSAAPGQGQPTATFVRIQRTATPAAPAGGSSAGLPLGYAAFAAIAVGLMALVLMTGGRSRR
jgi:hypothetical protein